MSSTDLPELEYLAPDLRLRVLTEILNPRYMRRTHAHRKTHDAGCRGPLCVLAMAQYDEGRRRLRAQAKGRPYTVKPRLRSFDRDTEALLVRAQNDYKRARDIISAQAS